MSLLQLNSTWFVSVRSVRITVKWIVLGHPGVWYITGISLWHPSWLFKVFQVDMVLLMCELWCGMAFLCCTGLFSLKFMAPRLRKSKKASAKKTNSVQIEKGGIIL